MHNVHEPNEPSDQKGAKRAAMHSRNPASHEPGQGLYESPSERALNLAALVAIFALIALAIVTYVLLKRA